MEKKSSASFQPGALRQVKNEDITLDERALAELEALEEWPIDLTDPDAPEVTEWGGAVRGKFYRPVKKAISIRVDADVLAWFQAQGGRYQRRMNEALREYMVRHRINDDRSER